MNPAKFREDKIVDFREIPNKNFEKILEYFGQNVARLVLSVIFTVIII